jgi:tetratricopeptide (TPR) repeat protein
VEPVAWISGRTDLLAGVFILLSALAWVGTGSAPDQVRWRRLAAGCGCLFLGLLCKETVLVFPAVLLVWDFIDTRGSPDSSRTWCRRNGFWIFGWASSFLALAVLRFWVLGANIGTRAGGSELLADFFKRGRWLIAFKALLTHVRLLLVPWPLNAYYMEGQLGLTWLSILLTGLFVTIGVMARKEEYRRPGWMALVWSFGFMLPVSGLFSPYIVPVADRFLYLPSFGLSLLAGCYFAKLRVASARVAWTACVIGWALLIVLSLGTVTRSRTWRDEFTFFSALAKTSPSYQGAQHNLGAYYERQGRYREAIEAYQKALVLDPNLSVVHYNLGVCYRELGDTRNAITMFSIFIQKGFNVEYVYSDLGAELAKERKYDDSLAIFDKAVVLFPRSSRIHYNRGIALGLKGHTDESIVEFKNALSLKPDDGKARYQLILGYLKENDQVNARKELDILMRNEPSMAVSLASYFRE